MKTHLVAADWKSDQVLARLCRHLVEGLDWSVSTQPNPNADLNVFFPYITWHGHATWKHTPIAAWFTHDDVDNRTKHQIWVEAAKRVDLRLTSARMYSDQLNSYGPTLLVTPPVEHDRFYPDVDRPQDLIHTPPRIGLSGMVYPGGRKGEHLVKQLVKTRPDWEVVASGRGWPCPCARYSPEGLGDFYRSLDVFVCTSLIEGIPLPPLEAMACGIPVVIPRGVGLLDELPDLQNVFRYERGNYEALELAIQQALDQPVNADSLVEVAGRYTVKQWCEDWYVSAVSLTNIDETPTDLPHWAHRSGVYYVAYGDPARDCAKRAIDSLHRWMPNLPAALASAKKLGSEDVAIRNDDEDIGGRSVKTKIYNLAPAEWDYVVYLDADTELVGRIDFILDALVAGWELVICTNPAQYHLVKEMRRPDNKDEIDELIKLLGSDELLQLNGGVFGFRRCERVARFFDRWHTEWTRYGKRDQAALDRALYAEPLRVLTLCRDWNCVTRYDQPSETTAITHYPLTARRWRGVVRGRLDSREAWAALHPEPDREPPPRKPEQDQ